MQSIRICLVEDQDLVRKSLGVVLGLEEDLQVVGSAENGKVGIEVCQREQPDVVLLDIHMPVMDGVTAAQEIKRRWPSIKIIMLTTFHQIEYVTKALHAGAEGYMLKDIDPKNLASVIRLIYAGETMIPHGLAKQLIERISLLEKKDNESIESSWFKEYGLNQREYQVLQHLASGLKNRDIAQKLFLSEGSVRNYISSIYSKLNVQNRAAAIKLFHNEDI